MDPHTILAVFPVIFVAELPDKTMFASLVLASRGHPRAVWVGAAGAFLVHVAIATTVGVGIFHLFPHRAVEAFVTALFVFGAVYAFVEAGRENEEQLVTQEAMSHRRVVASAFTVIFIAEWGDLTQILTANLAARYHEPLEVGIGAALALWAVAAVAVVSGQGLMRHVSVRRVRQITGAALALLAIVSAWSAIRG